MPRIPVTTKCRQQTADLIQKIDCRLQSGYKMQTKNLKSFYVWYIITCHLTAYRASRNRSSAISLHDYLHYCGIFLAHFLMEIDRNIISISWKPLRFASWFPTLISCSPNLPRVYIRLCKHGNHFTFLHCYLTKKQPTKNKPHTRQNKNKNKLDEINSKLTLFTDFIPVVYRFSHKCQFLLKSTSYNLQ